MVVITPFGTATLAPQTNGRDDASEECLQGDNTVADASSGYFSFHVKHVAEHNDHLCINSFCLPVYATLSQAKTGTTPQSKGSNNASSRRTKRGARPTSSGANHFASYNNESTPSSARLPIDSFPTDNPEEEDSFLQAISHLAQAGKQKSEHRVKSQYNGAISKEVKYELGTVTRSGRQTKTMKSVDYVSDDSDYSPRKKRSKKGSRKSGGGGGSGGTPVVNYNAMFADLVGNYKFYDKITVHNNLDAKDPPLSTWVELDSAGKVISVRADSAPLDKLPGLDRIEAGDVLQTGGNPITTLNQSTGQSLLFKRENEKYISKLCGLQGELIHPTLLYEAVNDLGGYETVVSTRKWQTVRLMLKLKKNTTSSGFSLRKAYEVYFLNDN